ncbi:MAG: hypothetical protein LBT97_10345 [Planctomycetota bacterium]|jgi:hypothetical protein|nr:hypothetical protein [Planctomycetota bacterium]
MTGSSVKKIDARLEQLEPGGLRHRVLSALRRFRASWIELGGLLTEVVFGGAYKEWGYDDFEVYCARELGLKKPTVHKLMVSYNYMRKYEGDRLRDFAESPPDELSPPMPGYQTVELLDQVRRREGVTEEEALELHRRAFDADGDGEPGLRKELRERLRPRPGNADADADRERRRELADILRLSRDLRRRIMRNRSLPGDLRDRIEQCLVELEALE